MEISKCKLVESLSSVSFSYQSLSFKLEYGWGSFAAEYCSTVYLTGLATLRCQVLLNHFQYSNELYNELSIQLLYCCHSLSISVSMFIHLSCLLRHSSSVVLVSYLIILMDIYYVGIYQSYYSFTCTVIICVFVHMSVVIATGIIYAISLSL